MSSYTFVTEMVSNSNIWVAASDGDLSTVKAYIESNQFTANSKDPNGYTPIHAAVSYGHTELLKYLIENGGDINIQDAEGDSPLHHVEDAKLARLLVETYKADWKLKNQEGQTPADYIEEDDEFPEVVQYLRSLNHDNPSESILDTLPLPDEVQGHQISYSYQTPDDLIIDIDDSQRLQLKEIVESENPEERLTEFLKKAVKDQHTTENEASPASKKRRE